MSKKVIHYVVRGKRRDDYMFGGRRGLLRACEAVAIWSDTLPL